MNQDFVFGISRVDDSFSLCPLFLVRPANAEVPEVHRCHDATPCHLLKWNSCYYSKKDFFSLQDLQLFFLQDLRLLFLRALQHFEVELAFPEGHWRQFVSLPGRPNVCYSSAGVLFSNKRVSG